MADKRMFSRKLISSDVFLDMPLTAQGLFFHLCMRADDDGFVDAPNRIVRECQATPKDLEILERKRYILTFENSNIGFCTTQLQRTGTRQHCIQMKGRESP